MVVDFGVVSGMREIPSGARRPARTALRPQPAEGLRVRLDVRLPGKRKSNYYGARPVHLIITMIQWIWTSRLSIKNSLAQRVGR
jgi:hypothetical protein